MAVEKFVKFLAGTASAAKTTTVEIVKVSKDGRDTDLMLGIFSM